MDRTLGRELGIEIVSEVAKVSGSRQYRVVPTSNVDPALSRAIYGLISVIATNIIVGWGKSIYEKHKMFRQLIAEVRRICTVIEGNEQRVSREGGDDNAFPLLQRLWLPIHSAKIGEVMIFDEIGNAASDFISNCNHYNQIIELGEKDRAKAQRKAEVLNQGALIWNRPVRIYQTENGVRSTYIAQAEKYISALEAQAIRFMRFAKWFPWYLVIFWHEKHHHTDTHGVA